jgi:hypothetical protein
MTVAADGCSGIACTRGSDVRDVLMQISTFQDAAYDTRSSLCLVSRVFVS